MPLKLEDIRKGAKVRGILPQTAVTIKSVDLQLGISSLLCKGWPVKQRSSMD